MNELNKPVTFDKAAFEAWLDAPSELTDPGAERNRDAHPYAGAAWQRAEGATGWMLEALLSDLTSDALPGEVRCWRYAGGVTAVRVWAIADPESDVAGDIAGEVVVDGVPLSLGAIVDGDLVVTEHDVLPGYEAAGMALEVLADRVNDAVWHYRKAVREVAAGHDMGRLRLALQVLAKLWFHARNNGVPKKVTVTADQHAAADAVLAAVEAGSLQAEAARIADEG